MNTEIMTYLAIMAFCAFVAGLAASDGERITLISALIIVVVMGAYVLCADAEPVSSTDSPETACLTKNSLGAVSTLISP